MEIHAGELRPGDVIFGSWSADRVHHVDVREVVTHRPREVRVFIEFEGEVLDLPSYYFEEDQHVWIRRPIQ